MGNIKSISNAFNYLDSKVYVTDKYEKISKSESSFCQAWVLLQGQ